MKKIKDKYPFIGHNHLLNIILKSFMKIIFNPLKYINRCDFSFAVEKIDLQKLMKCVIQCQTRNEMSE